MAEDGTVDNSKAQDPAARFTAGVDRIQDNAKWLLTVFAAVAGVLTAGIQLSSVGKLDFGARLWIAIIAGALAVGLVGAIIASIVTIITPRYLAISTLARLVSTKTWTGKERRELAFIKETGLLGEHYESVAALQTAYSNTPQDQIPEIYSHVRVLLTGVMYEQVRYAFRRASFIVFVCGAAAAVAIGVFAWAANPHDNPSKLLAPSEALVSLSSDGQRELAPLVGKNCVKSPIKVAILSDDGQSADVITEPDGHCSLARFTVGNAPTAVQGTLLPASQVPISP